MAEAQAKGGPAVPESVLKKQKRNEELDLKKKEELAALKKKNSENRKLIFNRAKLYVKEYEEQVTAFLFSHFMPCSICFFYDEFLSVKMSSSLLMQQKELVQLKREARLKGGFYVNPEAKLLFIVRIRGYVS